MMNQRNDSVTLDNVLEPLDEVSEVEPEEDEPTQEPVAKEKVEPALEPLDEIEEEQEKPAAEKEEEEEEEKKAEPAPEPEPEPETVTPTDEEVEDDEDLDEEEAVDEESEDSDLEEDEVEDEDEEDEDEDEDEEVEPEAEKKPKETEEEKIIRGSAGKLKGTKVLGKTAFTSDLSSDSKTRKKRKRRKDIEVDSTKPKTPAAKTKSDDDKKKPRKRKAKTTEVAETDVDKMMRETMKKMQSSKTVGSKRSKRRRQRKEDRDEELQQQAEMEELESGVIETTEFITANELADLLDVGVNDIISVCMSIGLMITINQRLDAGTIELVAEEYGKDVEFIDAEDMSEELTIEEDAEEDLKPRAPIITVMGHVDHGKTSLLDYIRKERVAAGEAGGITQHVGAYEVIHNEKKITFLDTPGHEAFTAMRSRGAQATDIVILVVAADDSVMPQTIEAINHAKAADVPLVVAINKIDKAGVNPDKIKQQLSEHDVIVEDWGGQIQYAEVSAHTGQGIEDLLEKVLIVAVFLVLNANPGRRADGVVLEARLDKG
ncbi:MAG: translation initiation factor IF-2 N-terminal domain-containing protein, partial [Balneolaceae bacterium]